MSIEIIFKKIDLIAKKSCCFHAVRTQTPPASLILFSAVLEKSLALTMTGILGRVPLPNTLK